MSEKIASCGGIELWTESLGDPKDPTILLITSTQSIWWEEEFCELLIQGGRHVIRYDNRDTGLSAVADPYSMDDLVQDAVCVLDAYGIVSAHVVGCFTGGFIAQCLALEHGDRVDTLTLISTTPVLRESIRTVLKGEISNIDLPLPKATDHAELSDAIEPWNGELDDDRVGYIEGQLKVLRNEAGSRYPFNEERWRSLITREYERALDWRGHYRQWDAILNASPDLRPRLRGLDVPTIVFHGTEDRTIPIRHAEAIAESIPGARLIPVEGLGHQFHEDVYPIWAKEILALSN